VTNNKKLFRKTLPKAIVLKKSEMFRYVMQHGTSIHGECFTIFYLPNSEFKIGFAVSNKIRTKPKRNRLKRMTREGVRSFFRRVSIHAHIIFIAKPRALLFNYLVVQKEIEQHFLEIEKRLCSL
jgi:ribonuclease P protein component